ncbi:hypothetical protein NEHOM01_2455 [Nematocida homosporus]|uniref:uncharacterized protein n=1 Tax=Nematocida homosporus TaxID=1912981 RepID=UPI00221ECC6D|nr:uncharacterized protein NEHOM01_2455 [Nematocida homosporus]KAI5187935.1 hypothetical protein NEHOM01_2455 [Nematocida homosporus]
MDRIISILARRLAISVEESEIMIKSALHSSTPEQELFDLLGEDEVDSIAVLLSSLKPKWSPPTGHCIMALDATIDRIMAPKLQRNTTDMYDEYILEAAPSAKTGELVAVTAISPAYRRVFAEYTHFNLVQSMVFNSVYGGEENVLVSAPTGAGKTDIAVLAIVKHLETTQDSVEDKVVYIAPMKALAGEITSKLQNRLGVVVQEHTGDTELSKEEIARSRILICTPEKFDISTRKVSSFLLKKVSLIILDEVHIVNDSRGPVIESIVCRMKFLTARRQKRTRLIGISATLPNPQDMAQFLQVQPKHMHTFGREYRPVPIVYSVIGTRKAVDVSTGDFTKRLDTKEKMVCVLQEKIEPLIAQNQQVLVFVHTRGDTLAVAEELCATLPAGINELPSEVQLPEALAQIYTQGLFVHHAGLPRAIRNFAEHEYRQKRIKVLVSTSTLAWGVNLPARAVIIFGTSYYSPETGTRADVSVLDVQQMFGRAGRPQYDTQAEGILITDHKSLQKYVRMLRAEDPIESLLLKSLPARMCAEMYLRNIKTHQDAVTWLKSTFLWVRMQKAPERYGTIYTEREAAIKDYATLTIDRLKSLDLLTDRNEVTDLGRIISHYSISKPTLLAWNTLLEEGNDKVVSFLAEAEEFSSFSIRAEDRAGLGLKHSDTEIDKELKIKILLDKHIQKREIRGYSLKMDQKLILDSADRLLSGLSEYCHYKQKPVLSYHALFTKKQIEMKGRRHEILPLELSLSVKPNAIKIQPTFSGVVYLRHNGKITSITHAHAKKEYLLNSRMLLKSITPIDRKLILNSRLEIVPVRQFSEYELWFVDQTLHKIAGYTLAFLAYVPAAPSTGISFKRPDLIEIRTLPNVSNEEFKELAVLLLYEEIKRLRQLKQTQIYIIVPYAEDEQTTESTINRLSQTEGYSLEPNSTFFSTNNGIVVNKKKACFPWTVCISEVKSLKENIARDAFYLFCGFSKAGVLYTDSVLKQIPKSSAIIYEREHESLYIRQRYL